MQPLEHLAKLYAKDIDKELSRFGLNIRVEEKLEQRPATAFDHALLFGNYGFNDDDIAILASSEDASYNDIPIQFMIIPNNPAGALLVAKDKSAVAADFFYVIEEGVIKAVHTREPVQLDLLELRLDLPYGNAARNKIPYHVLSTKPKTQDFTDSKADTNAILHAAGILVPKQYVLASPPYNYSACPTFFIGMRESYLENILGYLSTDRFVLKGDNGCGGEYVRMFGKHEVVKAINYIVWLQENNKKVLLEERILPLQWKNEDDQHIDWNIRAFVTLEEKPQWIDAIVRYNLLTGSPVNICQHAHVEELEKTVERTGASMKSIRNTARNVARAVYDHIKNSGERPTGFLGLDLMVSEKGVYTLEVNSAGSGGFAELLEIRKKPLASVRHLLESMGPLLEHNHAQRTLKHYKRIPNTVGDYLDVAQLFDKSPREEGAYIAIRLYEKAVSLMRAKATKTGLPVFNKALVDECYKNLIDLYTQTEQYTQALACHEEWKKFYQKQEKKDFFKHLLKLGAAYERR